MTDATRFLGGKFLTAENVKGMKGDEATMVIDHVAEESISGQTKLVIYFQDQELGLPLNTTRIEAMIELHGGVADTDKWRGTKIHLVYDPSVRFQGKRVGGIAIEAAK